MIIMDVCVSYDLFRVNLRVRYTYEQKVIHFRIFQLKSYNFGSVDILEKFSNLPAISKKHKIFQIGEI